MLLAQVASFWDVHLGEWLTIGALLVAVLAYRNERSKERRLIAKDQDATTQQQVQMHTENKQRLSALMEFQKYQTSVNERRDVQINELTKQTATLTQIAQGQDRRVQLVEDELRDQRRQGRSNGD